MRGSPFFEGVRQVDVVVGGEPAKLPCFYYDAFSMTATFPARLGALRALMPDPGYVPARLAPGVGLVAINCVECRDTDVGPYNEVGVYVVLNGPGEGANLPGRALWRATRSGRYHTYAHHLPVTSDVALRGGVDFYNFPKFLAAIEFREEGDRRSCRLAEGQEHILTLRGLRIPATKTATARFFCHLWMDGQPQTAEASVHLRKVATTVRPGAAILELGAHHPIALELARLLLSRHPLQYEYAPSFESILFAPERLTPPLLISLLDSLARAPELAAPR